jgi:hypothetical protein
VEQLVKEIKVDMAKQFDKLVVEASG